MKKKIFISHIGEEHKLAIHLKTFLTDKFIGAIDIFVSSDYESIKLGDNWMDNIKNSLIEMDLMIVIVSPISVNRPWINFESGCGWIRNIPVIPMCHSGLFPSDLSFPLKTLQAGILNNVKDIGFLMSRIAEISNFKTPIIQDNEFIPQIELFEKEIVNLNLFKDTEFIKQIFSHDLFYLKYCIVASCFEPRELGDKNVYTYDFELLKIDFWKLYNLHNESEHEFFAGRKIFNVTHEYVDKLIENVKFVLSNSFYKVSPDLIVLFNEFLGKGIINNPSWYNIFLNLPKFNPRQDIAKLEKAYLDESKELPKYAQNSRYNMYLDYMALLDYLNNWILKFEEITGSVIESVKNNTP